MSDRLLQSAQELINQFFRERKLFKETSEKKATKTNRRNSSRKVYRFFLVVPAPVPPKRQKVSFQVVPVYSFEQVRPLESNKVTRGGGKIK